MNKDFVPYEQALALKELGFDEPCFGYYINESKVLMVTSEKDINYLTGTSNTTFISAPLYQQAFRWFREKYNLFGQVNIHTYFIYDISNGEFTMINQYDKLTKNYEEAELECLKKLIEIVKNGK